MSQTVLVTGATGQQGSALIDSLLSTSRSAVTVHALTRDPSSASAKALLDKHPQIKIFAGSFDNVGSIANAAKGCTSAFLNAMPTHTNMTDEAQHVQNLVEACSSVNTIKRIVYSSTGAMHVPDLTPVFDNYVANNPDAFMSHYVKSKKACEDAVTSSNFQDGWSILRGGMFYSNFVKPFATFMYPDMESKQTITTGMREDYQISIVDTVDIGVIVAEMITSTPEEWDSKWKGKCVPFASENITMTGLMGKANDALAKQGVQKQIKVIHLDEKEADEAFKKGDLAVGTQIFMNDYLPTYDFDEIKSFGIDTDQLNKADNFFARVSQTLVETVGGA